MEDMRTWMLVVGFLVSIISQIVAIVWSWAKMDKKITVVDMKVDNVAKDLREVKDNHLQHLDEKIVCLSDKLTEHLINHNK